MPATPSAPALERPAPARAFLRGLRKRCPWCGSSGLFERWFRMKERCPRCHLKLHRHEGQMTGDIGVNTVVSFAVLFVVLLTGALTTGGRDGIGLFIAIGLAVTLLFPLWFFPRSKTLWLAIDLTTTPPTQDEFE